MAEQRPQLEDPPERREFGIVINVRIVLHVLLRSTYELKCDLYVIDLCTALSPRTRIYIGSAVFVFAGAALYFEPLIFPEPETLRKAPGPRGDVLIDAKDGERLPVGLRVVDRKVTKWD
jgi:hypothetical protein